MKSTQKLVKSQHDDLDKITTCHLACFPDSLATRLGRQYIKKTLEWFLVSDNRFLFHIEQAGMVVGYCGGYVPKGLGYGSSTGMLQYAFKEAVIGVIKKPWLIFTREVIELYPFIFNNILRKINNKPVYPPPASSPARSNVNRRAGLVVIGVHPQFRGTGVFLDLIANFIHESKLRGVTAGYLSVKKSNVRGMAAYKKTGWQIEKETPHEYVLALDFASPLAASPLQKTGGEVNELISRLGIVFSSVQLVGFLC